MEQVIPPQPVVQMPQIFHSPIPGFSCLLLGPTGTGKTDRFRTLVDCGITPFVIFTEPHGGLLNNVPCPHLHWHYVKPIAVSFKEMIDSANTINDLSFELLTKKTDPNKFKHKQFIELLNTMHDFKCDRCGQTFGDISSWGTGRAICLDSMSGVNPMAMSLVVGDKPVKAPGDWQIAQSVILNLVQKLCTDRRCHFIMTAHLEREMDEVTGGIQLMAATLGRKLAPQIPRFFDEVLHTIREGSNFRWSNMSMNVDLKSRLLPFNDKLAPGFAQLVEAWKAKGGVIE